MDKYDKMREDYIRREKGLTGGVGFQELLRIETVICQRRIRDTKIKLALDEYRTKQWIIMGKKRMRR